VISRYHDVERKFRTARSSETVSASRPFPTDAEATTFALGCRGHPLDSEHHQLATSNAVVTGAGPEKNSGQAAIYRGHGNFTLVPQLWQRVALIPTSEPQFGQSWGAVAGCRRTNIFAARPSTGRADTAIDREAATVLLAALAERSIIPKSPCRSGEHKLWINLKNWEAHR